MNTRYTARIAAIVGTGLDPACVEALMMKECGDLGTLSSAAFAREAREAAEVARKCPSVAESLAILYGLKLAGEGKTKHATESEGDGKTVL